MFILNYIFSNNLNQLVSAYWTLRRDTVDLDPESDPKRLSANQSITHIQMDTHGTNGVKAMITGESRPLYGTESECSTVGPNVRWVLNGTVGI